MKVNRPTDFATRTKRLSKCEELIQEKDAKITRMFDKHCANNLAAHAEDSIELKANRLQEESDFLKETIDHFSAQIKEFVTCRARTCRRYFH